MVDFNRTTSEDKNFINLVKLLDADLAKRDGDDHSFYSQFNKTDKIKHCIVAYIDGNAVGCGALRPFDNQAVEIKRMFVHPSARKRGIATKILNSLESWAAEMNYKVCILETGNKQPEAIDLYTKCNYHRIPNYGPYKGVDNSVCFSKVI